ncbi:MAG: GntR family transcriptional regulator [Anaerolineae bacterium]|nr:GntR family transcriptional regulator [Anaerolineae bacterium]
MHLDKQHPRPVYLQLKEVLRCRIEQGIYFPHQKLPSERELCFQHSLSRMTARRALQALITEGYAYTRVGKGTFVSDIANISMISANHNGRFVEFVDDIETQSQQKLVEQLLSFDSVGVERTIREVLAANSLETVAVKLFPRVIRQLEQRWRNGEAKLLAQNYAFTTLRSQLIAMVNAATCEGGPKALLTCAPGDQHDIGLLLLALSLRRRGFVVVYLGSNFTTVAFEEVVETVQPQLICFSAATRQSAVDLIMFSREFQANPLNRKNNLYFTFGGPAFNQEPTLTPQVVGLYLGDTIETAILKIQDLELESG